MTLRDYYEKARNEDWAMIQFNWSTPEILRGAVQAAVELRSPLLLGTSEGDSSFIGIRQAVGLVEAYRKDTDIPIFLNLDHGKSFDYLKMAVDVGYDALHFDGSDLELEENIKQTKEIITYAREKGIAVVEGEVGKILGGSSIHKGAIELTENQYTNPEEAIRFAKETEVDSLAIMFGNVHGVFDEMPNLDFERLKKIENNVQSSLVLHGGSGIPDEQVLRAIELGIVKINISTELRAAYTLTLRKELEKKPDEVTPYKLLPQVVEEVQKVVEEKIKLYGSAGKA